MTDGLLKVEVVYLVHFVNSSSYIMWLKVAGHPIFPSKLRPKSQNQNTTPSGHISSVAILSPFDAVADAALVVVLALVLP